LKALLFKGVTAPQLQFNRAFLFYWIFVPNSKQLHPGISFSIDCQLYPINDLNLAADYDCEPFRSNRKNRWTKLISKPTDSYRHCCVAHTDYFMRVLDTHLSPRDILVITKCFATAQDQQMAFFNSQVIT